MSINEINVLVLAYLGDTIYEDYIRKYLINKGLAKVNDLQKEASLYVSAKGQASFLKNLIETDEGSHYLGEVALVQFNSPIRNLNTLFYNTLFDEKLAATADAIADGVVMTFRELEQIQPSTGEEPGFYMVQTGIFRRREYAEEELKELQERGYPAFMIAKNGLYYVRAGAFRNLENAIAQERQLRQQGFATFIVRT